MKANFIDLDLLLNVESRPWIVDKQNPNIPIMKIDNHQFNLFKSGIFRNQGNRVSFNGKDFWLPTEFMNKLKIKAKNSKVDISNLAISMQEFMNPELIENVPHQIDDWILNTLVNQQVDIYIITSRNTKTNLKPKIQELESKMIDMGLKVEGWFYLQETFSQRDTDMIASNKIKIILQHMIGLKVDGDKFVEEGRKNYEEIILWDDNPKVISLGKDINRVFESLLVNTDETIKLKIKDELKNSDNFLILKEWTHNKSNRFNQYEIELTYSNVVRSFENFKF